MKYSVHESHSPKNTFTNCNSNVYITNVLTYICYFKVYEVTSHANWYNEKH